MKQIIIASSEMLYHVFDHFEDNFRNIVKQGCFTNDIFINLFHKQHVVNFAFELAHTWLLLTPAMLNAISMYAMLHAMSMYAGVNVCRTPGYIDIVPKVR